MFATLAVTCWTESVRDGRVTYAFLPLLRSAALAIINLSSGLGSLPRVTTYRTPGSMAPSGSMPGELWRASEDERHGGATIVVDALFRKSSLKAGLDRATATDIVWILTASDIFWRLVRARRWSLSRYQNWLGDTLCEQLLPPAEPQPGS
jgi:hypothetical protein